MILAVIIWRGKTLLAFVSGNKDAVAYSAMLEETLLPFAETNIQMEWSFSKIMRLRILPNYTKMFFQDENVELLDWAPRSPEMNVIENFRGYLARSFYQGSRQFCTVDGLKEALQYEWENLPPFYIRTSWIDG